MIVKLLTKHHLEFLSLKEAAEAHLSPNVKLLEISCRSSRNKIVFTLFFRCVPTCVSDAKLLNNACIVILATKS